MVSVLSVTQAVVWSGSGDGLTGDWKAFSVPLELTEPITAVDFAPVGLSAGW